MCMQDASSFPEVPLHKLRWRCDPDELGFTTTDDLKPLEGILGQERALKALALGVEIAKAGYNIYVCGMAGTGKTTAVQHALAAKKSAGVPLSDLCYVFQFKQQARPRLLRLPAGQGKVLRQAMEKLIADLKQEIPRALASTSFRQRAKSRIQAAQRREARLFQQCEARIAPHFGLLWQSSAPGEEPELAPFVNDQLTPLSEIEAQLEAGEFSAEQFKDMRERYQALGPDFADVCAEVRRLRRDADEEVRTLERTLVRPIIQEKVQEAAAAFTDEVVQQYFQDVETALHDESERFHEPPPFAADKEGGSQASGSPHGDDEDLLHEFQVNVIVDNAEATGAPVIFETSPTFKNLFGSIESMMEYGGVWRSDFTGIRAGAMHRANGGYLIFDAVDAFVDPTVWPTLKRALRHRQSEIHAADQHGFMPGTTIKPEPIPCDVKVILIGDYILYDVLSREDDNFQRLFKVKADFDTTMPRQASTIAQYASFILRICREEALRPFDRDAVAAVVELGVRLAGRQNKLSTRLDSVADILREADYWAGKAELQVVTREIVEQAMRERILRMNIVQTHLHEQITEGLLLLATHGAEVGQINGLFVYETEEEYFFGCPMRITAVTTMGDTGVVNIEREVDLSDATHDKGVLILSGYLRRMYAHDKPLVFSASLCVEQSYDRIAGDSASAAEMYAVLSSLAELPIDQGIAVTGSVNQQGELQPISAVNEKIEGFFDVCHLQGLTGTQGVIIPQQNVDDLMLRQDVIEAIAAGQFHLYPVATIDEGLAILTGISAGMRDPLDGYPTETVNGRVDAQLRRFATQWHALRYGAGLRDEPFVPTP